MTEFELWLIRSLIVALVVYLWWSLRGSWKQILSELKDVNQNIKALGEKGIQHDGKLEMVQNQVKVHEDRLGDYSKRIREIEKKQDQCQYCNE